RVAHPEEDDRQALPPGYGLYEYRIERVLGSGGFGVTYLARDSMLGHQVAIKEYLPNELAARNGETGAIYPRSKRHGEEYGNGLTRFLLEARTLASFRHHNIIGVHRFFEANNTAYMVMAYEQGESLNTWLSRRLLRGGGTPVEALLVAMFVPLLEGLALVHEAGFLHRDIKPANIYVRDGDGSLVLLDFGAARQAGAGVSTQGLTSIVTPGYAPFEQYHAHGRQGPWSDLYAIGGVLYWFVTGRRPVEAAARVHDDPQESAVRAGAGRYGEDFLAAVDWALEVDERTRPQTVGEFLPVLTGAMPISRDELEPGGRDDAAIRMPDSTTVAAPLPQTARMDPQAAAVVLDAEPALVMGVEQSLESTSRPGMLAPDSVGPTTVTKAEQVTVIDHGGGMDALYRIPRWRNWIKWVWLGVALLLAAAAGMWTLWHGGIGPPLSLAVHPGGLQQSAAETRESLASLAELAAVLQKATGRPVVALPLHDFGAAAADGAGTPDLYLATVDQMGSALERLRLTPLARFRDFRVNLLVRGGSNIKRIDQLKGRSIASFPGSSSHGAIMMYWLGSNGLRPQDIRLRISRNPEAMIDALLFGQVDAVALPQYGADEALRRYGEKLQVLSRSEPYPGYVLAAGPRVSPELARQITDTLLDMHDTPAGAAALKAVRIRQTTGTARLERISAADVVGAAGRMERARRLFPASAVPLQPN
ncbi:MAG TPA: PhnD/SsuA/transferrin family substrate-binding protein, partial [Burkholderiales bacterium]|nr:PhnD/SsuA/transferrin family substrate-binding protein [Burkholderiales bacterium]